MEEREGLASQLKREGGGRWGDEMTDPAILQPGMGGPQKGQSHLFPCDCPPRVEAGHGHGLFWKPAPPLTHCTQPPPLLFIARI